MEHAPLLLDVVGEAVGHEPVVRTEHDDPVPLEPLDAVHGRERDLPGRARIVGVTKYKQPSGKRHSASIGSSADRASLKA